jgi:hypothetical protein
MSNYTTLGMSLGVSKKENRDKVKSKFVVFTAQDDDGGFAEPIKHIKFEDQLFPGAIELLSKYRMMKDGQPVVDAKGGYPIDLEALKASEDANRFKQYFHVPGGMVEYYPLKKGACYANNVDGERIKDKQGKDVVKTVIPVFVQVKFYIVNDDGKMVPNYANGMGLEENGDRLERQFYREAVVQQQPAPAPGEAAVKPESADPF